MSSLRAAREIALGLPEAFEADHFGRPSFRVGGRIFATVPDARHLNVMLDPFDVDAVVRAQPAACEELWWGKKLIGVRVDLERAPARMVRDLLEAAWRRKATAGLSSPSGQPERGPRKRQTRPRSAEPR